MTHDGAWFIFEPIFDRQSSITNLFLFDFPFFYGYQVNFGLYRGIKPLLVIADPREGSSEMREAMQQLNTRMPRKVSRPALLSSIIILMQAVSVWRLTVEF